MKLSSSAKSRLILIIDSNLITFILVALLSGVRNAKNSALSQEIYDHMKKIFPKLTDELTSAAVLLANIYTSSDDTEMALKVKRKMIKSGRQKAIGVSWTVINGEIFVRLKLVLLDHFFSLESLNFK